MDSSWKDTICAVSTPPGQGAVAMIRVSGPGTPELLNPCIRLPDTDFRKLEPNKTRLAGFTDAEGPVDDVMVTRFVAPKSYTGEEMAEITCHGSYYIQQRILQELVRCGARPAAPGEFTQRAFLNGKMDLAQAEAVADLIAAESQAAHKLALNQMKGRVSDKIHNLRTRLVDLASLMELELDFSEEDVEFADRRELMNLSMEILGIVNKLSESFERGNAIKTGIPVTIAGKPNVGKSTLLNALLQEDKAIVSEIPGTTRDAIEDTFVLEGIQFRLTDTAGIRKSQDIVEQMGVDRTFRKVSLASIILYMADVHDSPENVLSEINALHEKANQENQKIITLINKVDQFNQNDRKKLEKEWQKFSFPVILISARDGINIEEVRKLLVNNALKSIQQDQQVIISNIRHFEALIHTAEALNRMVQGMREGLSSDLLTLDLREAIHHLGTITGEISTDEILGNIFAKFCIGK